MSALVWAGIGGVVFGSSFAGLKWAGIEQIQISAQAVIDASPFYHGTLLGGVLQPRDGPAVPGAQAGLIMIAIRLARARQSRSSR